MDFHILDIFLCKAVSLLAQEQNSEAQTDLKWNLWEGNLCIHACVCMCICA